MDLAPGSLRLGTAKLWTVWKTLMPRTVDMTNFHSLPWGLI